MIDPGALYQQLGVLLASVPDLTEPGELSAEVETWLARAYALVKAGGDPEDTFHMKKITNTFYEVVLRGNAANDMMIILRRTAAVAELQAPPGMQGTYIHEGDVSAAMIALGKVLKTAIKDVLIVDPYMDETALSDFALMIPESVPVRLLSDEFYLRPTLLPARDRWVRTYPSVRPLEVRLAPDRTLHDRDIVVDSAAAYGLSQSLNAFAARSHATIARFDLARGGPRSEAGRARTGQP